MTTKFPLIAGAVVAAMAVCGTASAAASLIAPTAANFPAAQRFYTSGSTALDNGIKDLWTLDSASGGVCKHGTIDVYYDGPNLLSSSTHQYAVTCTTAIAMTSTDGTHTVAAGTNVAFFKDGSGGSFEGTKPEADSANRTYLDIFSGTFNCLTNGVSLGNLNPNGAGPYFTHQTLGTVGTTVQAQEHPSCTPSDTSAVPIAGFSDANDDMFTAQNGYPGLTPLTAAELSALTGHAIWQQQFGVAVSLNLYRVLQAAQGKNVGSDAAVDMPSLSKLAIATIMGGNINDWSQLYDPSGTNKITAAAFVNANGTALGTASGGTPLKSTVAADGETAASISTVFFCRRGDQSGTEAGANSYFLNNQCGVGGVSGSAGAVAMATNTTTPATNAACSAIAGSPLTVDENGCKWQLGAGATQVAAHLNDVNIATAIYPGNGTGDVDNCLNAHDYVDSYAIGILSGDRQYDDTSVSPTGHPTWGWGGSKDTSTTASGATTAHRWRYVAIDDKKPNLESVASGLYDYVLDNELYFNQTAINGLGGALTSNADAFIGYIETSLAVDTVVGDIETPQTHGTTGGILDPLNSPISPQAIPLTGPVTATPVSALTKALNGVQDCATAQIVAPALVSTAALVVPSTTGFTDGKTAGKGVPAPL